MKSHKYLQTSILNICQKKGIKEEITDYARENYRNFMYTEFFCGQVYMNIQRENGE